MHPYHQMKRIAFFLLSCFLLASCKKNNNAIVTATPQQIADVNAKLAGTWAVAGIPLNTLYPYSGSVNFSGKSQVIFNDFTNSGTQAPYILTNDGNAYYITLSSGDSSRKSKIVLLTADSLKLQSTISHSNPVQKAVINEVFVKANVNDINNKIFRINIMQYGSSTIYYNLNINVKIYITHKGSSEQLAEDINHVTQPYTYAYTPVIGDHIRIAVTDAVNPGNLPVFTCLAAYKGVPYGKDWESDLFSSLPDKSWDIAN